MVPTSALHGQQALIVIEIESRSRHVLNERLREARHARKRPLPINPTMTLTSDGLVL
jgi:hypothetical protein